MYTGRPKKLSLQIVKRTIRQCDKVFLKGKELERLKKHFECAEVAIKFQNLGPDREKNKFNGLMDILTSNATAEEKQCIEKTKVIEKMTTAFDAIKDTMKVDLYNLIGKGNVAGGLFGLLTSLADNTGAEPILNIFGIQTDPDITPMCRTTLDNLARGNVGDFFQGIGKGFVKLFTGTTDAEIEERKNA